MNKFKLFTIAVLLALSSSAFAQAISPSSPLQPGHYFPGIIGIRDAITPPPGLILIWYNWYFTSNSFIDAEGNKIEKFRQGNIDVDINVGTWATAPVLGFVSQRLPFLGGAQYIGGIVPQYFAADGNIDTRRSGSIIDTTFTRNRDYSLSGWTDLIVVPLGLSWAFGKFPEGGSDPRDPYAGMTDEEYMAETGMPPRRKFNVTFLYDFAAPTGRYELGADDNLGLGFWSHIFQLFGYYHPLYHQAVALEGGLSFETNSKIKDQDYRPGNRLTLEYGVSAFVKPWLELGVGGGNNWQISDDTGDDVWWDASVRDRKHVVNFQVAFMPVAWKFYIVTKYGFDYGARQRMDGQNFIVNLYYVTGLLDGR